MVTVVQVKQQRVDVWPKRSARRHALWRRSPEPLAAAGATPAEQLNPRGVRPDRWDVDVIVAMAHSLALM